MHCDCGARPEDIRAGIHNEPCTSRDGQPDDPSDHYGQKPPSRSGRTPMTSTPHPHNDCPACQARQAEARERREAAAETNERAHRNTQQRITNLEYGIDAALEEIADMDDASDPRKVIESVRHYLATYRAND